MFLYILNIPSKKSNLVDIWKFSLFIILAILLFDFCLCAKILHSIYRFNLCTFGL